MKRIAYLWLLATFLLLAAPSGAQRLEQIAEGPFFVEFATGEEEAAQRTLTLLRDAAKEYAPRLPLGDQPIKAVIAPNVETFRRYARGYLPGQIAGLAIPEHGLIILRGARMRGPADDYRGLIRHELVHILLHRNTDEAYLPRWLNEGLAMFLAREYQMATPITIGRMFLENRMIPYKDLDWAFLNPGQEMVFDDAYAQALSMTRFLYKTLGEERFWKVVSATRETPFHEALQQFGQINLAELMAKYLRSLWLVALVGVLASGSLFTPLAILSIVAYIRVQRRNQQTLDEWAEKEAEEDRFGGRIILSWEEAMDNQDTYIPGIDDEEED